MLKIAITGGAGSGKSTVAQMFRELGAPVLDADAAARDAVAVGTPAWKKLRRLFGEDYFHPGGELNRAKVSQLVFGDPEARSRLNRIVHPQVAQELQARLQELEQQGRDLVFVEVPLLFEAGLEGAYDRIIVVSVDLADQFRRLEDRDGRGTGEIAGIIEAQWPLAEKAARADFVVDNRGPLEETRDQVRKIWAELQKIGKSHLDMPGQRG
jgi:dephospho-CoA kinase